MSILTTLPARKPSTELAQIQIAEELAMITRRTYTSLCATQKRGIDAMWAHPELTPQQVADAVGTDAGKLMEFHAALTALLTSLAAMDGIEPDIKHPAGEWEVNPDGTLTVLAAGEPE